MLKQKAFMVAEYFRHWLRAENAKGHGVHSPFVFDFIQTVLRDQRHFYAFDTMEQLRNDLLQSKGSIQVSDFGAGSHNGAGTERRIADITRMAARTPKQGRFLFRLMQRYQYRQVLELGTSMGIGTGYLSLSNSEASVHTIEGCANIAAQAKQNLQSIGAQNVQFHLGNFDVILSDVLAKAPRWDLVFIDGNHREEPTCRYFEQACGHMSENGVMLFDDIHWSEGMRAAWEAIRRDERVRLSIDLYYFGLVFFDSAFKEKQDFVLPF